MAPQVSEGFVHVEGKLYDTETLAKLHPGVNVAKLFFTSSLTLKNPFGSRL
jgi:hypothetical protein